MSILEIVARASASFCINLIQLSIFCITNKHIIHMVSSYYVFKRSTYIFFVFFLPRPGMLSAVSKRQFMTHLACREKKRESFRVGINFETHKIIEMGRINRASISFETDNLRNVNFICGRITLIPCAQN